MFAKRISFLAARIAVVFFLGILLSSLLPVRGPGAIVWAQETETQAEDPAENGEVQPQPPPLPTLPPAFSPAPPVAAPAPGASPSTDPKMPLPAPQLPGAALTPAPASADQPASAPGLPPQMMGQPGALAPNSPAFLPVGPGSAPQQFRPAVSAPLLNRGGQFTLNFDDADVYTLIQTVFGEILRVNYVVDPRVKGRVTFRAIAPVPAENVLPLMEVILRLNGIGVVEENGLYRIVPIGDISKEPSPVNYGRDPEKIKIDGKAVLQVVPITYVQSSEALKLITPFASHNAVLIDVPKGNQLIIVDTDANVKRLLKLIEIFDNEKLRQRKPQIFVYQVQNSKAKDIATTLQQIFGGKGSAAEAFAGASKTGSGSSGGLGGSAAAAQTAPAMAPAAQPQISTIATGGDALVSDPVKIISDDITNTIVVMATPEDYDAIVKAIQQLDTAPRQVIIEGMIASVSLTDNLSLGVGGVIKGSLSGYGTNFGLNTDRLTAAALAQAGFSFVATDAAGVVRALLTALASDSKAKVLASPHILVSDNRDARIQVGQQVPLLTSETYGVAGVAPQRNYQYKDIVIILKVKPRINEGGLVSLEISQEISTPEKITLSGSEQLLINKTEATTNLVVQDGQTIVIGGLIREDTTKSSSGIPFLSKIPFIGWLFGGMSDDKSRTELIILLTPRVIKNQREARNVSTEFIDNMVDSSQERIKRQELIKAKPAGTPGGVDAPEASPKIEPQQP